LEALSNHLVEGKKALDVGSGTGYLTACMAFMVCNVYYYYHNILMTSHILMTTHIPMTSHI